MRKCKHHRQFQIDLEISEKETLLSVPSVLPDMMANAEKPKESPGAEKTPEQETEPEQGAEQNQPADRVAMTRPRQERHNLHVLALLTVDLSFIIRLNFARATSFC